MAQKIFNYSEIRFLQYVLWTTSFLVSHFKFPTLRYCGPFPAVTRCTFFSPTCNNHWRPPTLLIWWRAARNTQGIKKERESEDVSYPYPCSPVYHFLSLEISDPTLRATNKRSNMYPCEGWTPLIFQVLLLIIFQVAQMLRPSISFETL